MNVRAVDHLVVAAADLEHGAAWCEATLGVAPGPGGRHALMGTHNRLLAVGGTHFPQAYLEIIAIDPAAPPPARPRWFGLDEPPVQALLRSGPRLVHWVARTPAIAHDRQALIDFGRAPGDIVVATRGALSWRILLPPDGRLTDGGALPTLIQWDSAHPTEAMPASGVVLGALALRGLAPQIHRWLSVPGVDRLDGPGPALCARFATPRGPVTLESR